MLNKDYLIETINNQHEFIKELEIDRLNNNIKDTDRLKDLYSLYYRNIDKLKEM